MFINVATYSTGNIHIASLLLLVLGKYHCKIYLLQKRVVPYIGQDKINTIAIHSNIQIVLLRKFESDAINISSYCTLIYFSHFVFFGRESKVVLKRSVLVTFQSHLSDF